MFDEFEKYDYNLEYNRYEDSPYYCVDELIRDCLHDITPEQLETDLEKVKKQFDMYSVLDKDILPTLFYIMSAILFEKNNKQCLNRISETFIKETDVKEWRIYQSYSLNTCSQLTLIFMLTMFLLRRTDDEICRRLIDRWIAIQDCKSHEHNWSTDKVVNIEFIVSPLYPLMITEKYELIKYFFEKTAEVRGLTIAEMAKTLILEGYVESAVEYQQDEFLDLLYDYGFDFSNNMAVLAYIFSSQEHFDYISRMWDVRNEIVPYEKLQSGDGSARRRICVPREKQLVFLVKLFRNYGKDVCDRVIYRLCPFETIDEEDIYKLSRGHFIGEFSSYGDLDNSRTYNGIRYNINIIALLERYVSDFVTIIADKGEIDAYPVYFPGKKITFDMRNCGRNYRYCGLQTGSLKRIQSLLKSSDILFNTEQLTDFHRELLERNNAAIAKLMIKQGAFSDANAEAAISYLVENKLYNCLDQLNNMYFKEGEV